jgi:hypothetical protein
LEPDAHQVRLFAMSYFLIGGIQDPPSEGEEDREQRKLFRTLLQPLSADELVEVLKWPFCVGEAEKMVLKELEVKLNADKDVRRKVNGPVAFGGDVRKFVAQAESLGITNHKTPVVRPTLEDARRELDALLKASAAKP